MVRRAIGLGACLALVIVAGCATRPVPMGFDAAGVARAWQQRWDRTAWRVPKGSTVVGVDHLVCRRVGREEFPGVREFRRAYWCAFELTYREPNGATKTFPVERWLVGETERRLMLGA